MRAAGSGSVGGSGGMLRLLPMAFNFLGVKGTLILLVCVGAYGLFTGNLGSLLTGIGNQQDTTVSRSAVPLHETAQEKELVDFVSVILADTEDTWTALVRPNALRGSKSDWRAATWPVVTHSTIYQRNDDSEFLPN
jgi:predicted metalloprotease